MIAYILLFTLSNAWKYQIQTGTLKGKGFYLSLFFILNFYLNSPKRFPDSIFVMEQN